MEDVDGTTQRFEDQGYRAKTTLQEIEYTFAKIEKFNNTMNNFYQGVAQIVDGIVYIEIGGNEETKEEIYAVLHNARKYPDDYNLTARLYTQETNKKIGEILNDFGLEVYQKYMIGGSKDEDEYTYNEDNIKDNESISIYTEFTFADIKKFVGFLKTIEMVDDELMRNIALVINSLGQKIYKGFKKSWTDEEIDIYNGIGEIYEEVERLGIKNEIEIGRRSDYLLALKDGYLDKFKACVNVGFYTKISSEDILQPMFFEDNMDGEIDPREINDPQYYEDTMAQIEKDIKRSWYIFDEIKDTQPLMEKVTKELARGITNTINTIKGNTILGEKEKKQRLNKFNKYLRKIKYIHTKSTHKEENSEKIP